ncbi:MAG: YhdH/YhfP family quinone oxidoreductase [Bdellovibrionales bacterium]|nr:YhdH/YhfP family quinone oxidoreductase [Bdellovibrionales bacterium]
MEKNFRAYQIYQENHIVRGRIAEVSFSEIEKNPILVKVKYSSVNYKDALAGTGRGKILRNFPLIGGIDCAGEVVSSRDSQIKVGDPVIVTGCGLSETQNGGYGEYISVPTSSVILLPQGLSLFESMLLGTAGFTAGLCLHRLLQNGQKKEAGPILVTGASGGVGSLSTAILSQLGYEVHAVTSKKTAVDLLYKLGATRVASREEFQLGSKPLESIRFAGAIDNVGGSFLSQLLSHINLWGNVASVGLAESPQLQSTVMPFILRGVSLLGISSNNAPLVWRKEIWSNLATTWKPKNIKQLLFKTIPLEGLEEAFQSLLDRKVVGRIVVDVNPHWNVEKKESP